MYKDKIGPPWYWVTLLFGATAVCVVVAIIASILGYTAWSSVNKFNQPVVVYTSQMLQPSPYAIYIDASGAPATLTLPAVLDGYFGNVYRIYSNTAQMHVVRISAGGATFDGGTRTATFGGDIRDGFEFEVTSGTIANVKSIKNVVFS